MRALVALARPRFGGAQRIALAVARGLPDSVLAAPAAFELIERGRRMGLATAVMQAPEQLLRYGHETARLSTREQLRLFAKSVLPYARGVGRRLTESKIDVVYAGEERAQVLIGMGAALAGIPTVWHLQGGVATRIPPVQIMCALLSQEIVCISHAVERDVRSYLPGLCLPRTCVVYNGLPDQPLQRREGVNRLVSVSRIAPAKGLHHAIDALALVRRSHPDVVLDIVGELSANPGYVRLLQRKVTDCGLTGAVNFVGHVEDVHAVFSRATLTLCPSVEHETLAFDGREQLVQNKEGFCLSAAEAMRAGCPVVASSSYGLREVVADGVTGAFVPPSDPEALGRTIVELLDDPERRRVMGLAGRARFEANFRERGMLDGIDAALRRAVAGPPRPHLAMLTSGATGIEALLRLAGV